MFGFSGATLTTEAVDPQNCTRCSAADILAYLNGSGLTFDIDGDGELVALTDGLDVRVPRADIDRRGGGQLGLHALQRG
jgi:hypothetical protein